jgi:hypothetical protein
MHVAKVVSRQGDREYVSHLVRQSYREDGKVKHRTLANLSALPEAAIDAVRRSLAGESLVPVAESLTIQRTFPTVTLPPSWARPRSSVSTASSTASRAANAISCSP